MIWFHENRGHRRLRRRKLRVACLMGGSVEGSCPSFQRELRGNAGAMGDCRPSRQGVRRRRGRRLTSAEEAQHTAERRVSARGRKSAFRSGPSESSTGPEQLLQLLKRHWSKSNRG